MRFAFCTMVLTICGCVSEHKDKRSESVHSPRLRFTRSLSQIEKGMAAQQVLVLLGPPEDIRTLNDPGGISTIGTKEIWRYGTSGHLTIATLGQIYVDQDSRVQYICGKGEPPPEGLFEEEELRRFLIALDEVPSYQAGRFFNPRALIVAVNLLQPLGKERALAAIAEYLRVACELQDDRKTGAFLVLRVLFEVPEDTGYMPPMRVGVPGPPAPNDPKLLPRFPITIEGDIPFLLIDGLRMRIKESDTLSILILCLTDNNEQVRVAAAVALGEVRSTEGAAREALIKALKDPKRSVIDAAKVALEKLPNQDIKQMTEMR